MDGDRIKYEIKKRGFTIRGIASKIGMSEQNLGQQLNNKKLSVKLMESIAEAMEMSVADFYDTPSGDNIAAYDHSTAFKGNQTCDHRLLDIIQARDRQIDKCQQQNEKNQSLLEKSQEQIDRLIAIIEKMQEQ